MNHTWSARKQHLHLQSADGTSCHSALSEDRIRQCGTSSESCGKDTDQCLQVAISFCRHCSVPVPCKNGSVETNVANRGQNLVARLWGHTLGGNWPLELTSSYASIDFCGCKSSHSGFLDVSSRNGGLRNKDTRHHWDVFTILVPDINIQTYLLTYSRYPVSWQTEVYTSTTSHTLLVQSVDKGLCIKRHSLITTKMCTAGKFFCWC